jgi:hypothetical protein
VAAQARPEGAEDSSRPASDLAALTAEVADLRRRVEASEGVLGVLELKARYGDLVDARFRRGAPLEATELRHLAGEIAGLFTEDAEWDGGPTLGLAVGREEIAARMREPTISFSRHLFVRPLITVDGDRASGRWDLLSPCTRPDGTAYWMCGVEDDEYQRDGAGVWRHRRMRLSTVFMAPVDGGFGRIGL